MHDIAQTLSIFEPLKSVVIFVNVVLFVVTLLLFVSLLFHKIHVERRARRLALLKECYLSELTRRFYDTQIPAPRPTNRLEFEALGGVLATMLVNVSGGMAEYVKRSIREIGIDAYYRRALSSRSWVKRFVALERLGYFRFPELKNVFTAVLESEHDPRLLAKAIWALSLIAEIDDLPVINQGLQNPHSHSAKFNEFIYSNIIKAFREREQELQLVEQFERFVGDPSLPVMLKRDMIQACGIEIFYPVQALVTGCFRQFHDVPEMRIACIRALERFSAVDTEWLLLECLADDDWRVRGVAARSAHLYSPMVLPALTKLLYDPNYHVRINSARSLTRMGEAGLNVLVRETRSADRFVRDVSQYMLKRVIYAP